MEISLSVLLAFVYSSVHFVAGTDIDLDRCPASLPRDGFLKVFGHNCYRFRVYKNRDYPEAEADCAEDGGTLALIKSQEIEKYIVSQLLHTFHYSDQIWIGLNDRAIEGQFTWEDGTPLRDSDYSHWDFWSNPGLLPEGYEDCVALDPLDDGKWKNDRCTIGVLEVSHHKSFVCQYDLVLLTAPSNTTTTTITTSATKRSTTIMSIPTTPTAMSSLAEDTTTYGSTYETSDKASEETTTDSNTSKTSEDSTELPQFSTSYDPSSDTPKIEMSTMETKTSTPPNTTTITTATSAASRLSQCPSHLPRDGYLTAYGNNCFRFHLSELKEYTNARSSCKNEGGTLALVKTAYIQNHIANQLDYTYFYSGLVWIGLNDRDKEGVFRWEDGSELASHDYERFASGQGPDHSIYFPEFENCIVIDPVDDFKWHDYHCSDTFLQPNSNAFICQFDAV